MPPGPAKKVVKHGPLCSSYQGALGHSRAAADLGLQQNTTQEGPELINLDTSFRLQQSTTSLAPQVARPQRVVLESTRDHWGKTRTMG